MRVKRTKLCMPPIIWSVVFFVWPLFATSSNTDIMTNALRCTFYVFHGLGIIYPRPCGGFVDFWAGSDGNAQAERLAMRAGWRCRPMKLKMEINGNGNSVQAGNRRASSGVRPGRIVNTDRRGPIGLARPSSLRQPPARPAGCRPHWLPTRASHAPPVSHRRAHGNLTPHSAPQPPSPALTGCGVD